MLRLKVKDLFKNLLHILHKEQTNPASRPTLLTVEKVHSWLPERRRLFLLINGVISVLWGIALIIFSFGVVPIAWTISQAATKPDGQYSGLTNVVINALTTLASLHLTMFTVQPTLNEYISAALHSGITLHQWSWIQAAAQASLLPPFWPWRKDQTPKQISARISAWFLWWLIWGSMKGFYGASLTAILQPQVFYKHFPFNDPAPCGVDPGIVSLQPMFAAGIQSNIDQVAFGVGLQVGNYYNQLAANTTTSVAGRLYLKDNYGYAAIGGLVNGLQNMTGVVINAQCSSTQQPGPPSPSAIWSSAFPGYNLPTVSNFKNGSSTFNSTSIEATPSQAIITSAHSFNLNGTQQAMYAIVNATGGGAVITVDARGNMTACAWTVIPQLVDVVILNFTAYAAATTENATIMPAPAGRATYLTVQGMAQAINLGARLDTNYGNTQPAAISDTAQMLQVLIADGIKGAVTAYTDIVCSTGCSFPSGQVCDSNNRTIQQHWRFGNEHNLGWLAIILTIGFGLAAVYMVWYLRKRPYIRGIDPLKIVDAFDMGMHYDRSAGYGGGKAIQIRNGKVVSKVMWNNGDDVEGIPLRIGRETAYTRMYNE